LLLAGQQGAPRWVVSREDQCGRPRQLYLGSRRIDLNFRSKERCGQSFAVSAADQQPQGICRPDRWVANASKADRAE